MQRLPGGYFVDPADPRAPSQEVWNGLTPDERARVVATLPIQVPLELQPPEGDPHWLAKATARSTLDEFFRRAGRRIYVSSELAVYYPGERRFSPDVLAVLDVEPRQRTSWIVADEGKGLDFVLEVHFAGDREKDYETNVDLYARLGVAEYFVFDCRRFDLRGHRLPPPAGSRARTYRPILPQGGRYASQVLGLDLMTEGPRLRFFHGTAPLLEADELVAKLGSALDEVIAHKQEAEQRAVDEAKRAADEAKRAADEAKRADDEAKRVIELQRRVVELEAELARLRGGGAT